MFKNSSEGFFQEARRGYYYQRLSLAQQHGYDAVLKAILAFQKKVQMPGVCSREEMESIIRAVIFEQPQLFYFNSKNVEMIQSGSQFFFLFEYLYAKKQAAQLAAQIEENVSFLLSQIITDDMEDYGKCLAVHDYMTKHMRYNFSALSVGYVYDAYTIEGPFVKNQAVCEGIAKAVSHILNRLGIENMVIAGSSDIDGVRSAHAWNMVKLADDYYHMDVTWDLQEINHFTNNSHTYVNLDDDSMLGSHHWELQDYPSCDAKKENYYVKENRYFRSMRSFELYVQKFLKESQTFLDVRFEDTLGLPDDNGKYLAGIIRKNAAYIGRCFQITFVFHPDNYVFQANVAYS